MKFFLYILYTLERKKGRVRKYEYEYNENMKKGHGWENAKKKMLTMTPTLHLRLMEFLGDIDRNYLFSNEE